MQTKKLTKQDATGVNKQIIDETKKNSRNLILFSLALLRSNKKIHLNLNNCCALQVICSSV